MTTYGVLLPTFDALRTGAPFQVTEAARLAEELEFDSVWTGDHLACPAPILDAPTALMAAAAVTERVDVGLSVMLLGIRPLAWTAKQLSTIQTLSGGRLRVGVGIGGEFPEEYEAAGVPLNERGARLDAALERLPAIIGGERSGEIGPLEPGMPMPPLLVGGRSDAALRRAARFADRWLPMWVSPATLTERAQTLAELARGFERPTPKLSALILCNVNADLSVGRAQADAHTRGQYGMPLDRVEKWTALGDEETIAAMIDSYREVGVDEFVLMPLGGRSLEQYERLAGVLSRLPSPQPQQSQ